MIEYVYAKDNLVGKLISVSNKEHGKEYYYKIYLKIEGKRDKVVSQSFVNIFDRKLCVARMLDDIELLNDVIVNSR